MFLQPVYWFCVIYFKYIFIGGRCSNSRYLMYNQSFIIHKVYYNKASAIYNSL